MWLGPEGDFVLLLDPCQYILRKLEQTTDENQLGTHPSSGYTTKTSPGSSLAEQLQEQPLATPFHWFPKPFIFP